MNKNIMNKKLSKGFTLIELLVVIAIIGVLSSVVLANLNSARTKGNVAAIKADLATVRAQAAIVYGDSSNSYGTAFTACTFTDPGTVSGALGTLWSALPVTSGSSIISKALTHAESLNGVGDGIECNSAEQSYAISVSLPGVTVSPTAGTGFWCVDSTGTSKDIGAALSTGVTTCP